VVLLGNAYLPCARSHFWTRIPKFSRSTL